MKTVACYFIFIFIAFHNHLTLACPISTPFSPFSGVASESTLCFQPIEDETEYLFPVSMDQIRFVSSDNEIRYSFSGNAFYFQFDNKKFNKMYSNTILDGSDFSSSLVLFFDGMNTESQLIGIHQTGSGFSVSSESIHGADLCKYQQIYYTDIYPGIDLRFSNHQNHLLYEYLITPGFDYKEIKMRFEGASDFYVNLDGELEIVTNKGIIVQDAPLAEQEGVIIPAIWMVKDRQVSIIIPNYDSKKELKVHSIFRLAKAKQE